MRLALVALSFSLFAQPAAAQERSTSAPELPKVYTAKIIKCPAQTEVAPNAQALLSAGQTPELIPSLYPEDFIAGVEFCTVSVAPDGQWVKKYSKLTQLGDIQLRLDFNPNGFDLYAGDRAGDLVTNLPDIRCTSAIESDQTATCSI